MTLLLWRVSNVWDSMQHQLGSCLDRVASWCFRIHRGVTTIQHQESKFKCQVHLLANVRIASRCCNELCLPCPRTGNQTEKIGGKGVCCSTIRSLMAVNLCSTAPCSLGLAVWNGWMQDSIVCAISAYVRDLSMSTVPGITGNQPPPARRFVKIRTTQRSPCLMLLGYFQPRPERIL